MQLPIVLRSVASAASAAGLLSELSCRLNGTAGAADARALKARVGSAAVEASRAPRPTADRIVQSATVVGGAAVHEGQRTRPQCVLPVDRQAWGRLAAHGLARGFALVGAVRAFGPASLALRLRM